MRMHGTSMGHGGPPALRRRGASRHMQWSQGRLARWPPTLTMYAGLWGWVSGTQAVLLCSPLRGVTTANHEHRWRINGHSRRTRWATVVAD
jgi:hypothetical protein